MRRIVLFLNAILIVSCTETTRFRLIDQEHSGIDFINLVVATDSLNVLDYEYIYNGAGVGIGDLNNDGLQDIIFAGNQVSSRVYLNLGNFKFRDITSNFPGLTNNQWYSGVVLVDINNDRLVDVYLTSTAGSDPQKRKNRLWVNQGTNGGTDPVFREMAEDYGIADEGHSTHAAFFDYDLDGDLDLYVLNNAYVLNSFFNEKIPSSYRPRINDGSALNNDRLYRNNGNGSYSDITIEAGIVHEGCGLGLAVSDVNKDGYPDIYISNDYLSNDLLYINQGDGTFRNEIKEYLSYQTKSSMGNDISDINNDGNPDIYTMDMIPEDYSRKKQTINGLSYNYYIYDEKFDFEHQYIRNMFHLHNGFINDQMLPFSEMGQIMGLYQSEWSWSPLFADYDNDGDKDLIITNGYPVDLTDKDWTFYKMKTYKVFATAQTIVNEAPSIKVPNMAFENTDDLRFIKKNNWLSDIPSYSNGASFADLDNDGDLDYVINNLDDKAFIYRNYTAENSKNKANFIRISLTGLKANTMAIGAKVELWCNKKYQYMEHFLSRGYASSVDPVIHFGLSENSLIDSIKVTWPATGKVTILKKENANRTIYINESDSIHGRTNKYLLNKPDYIFEKKEGIINYIHEQVDFADFFLNQKIIPHKFSQIGPCMAKGDIDNDGREDIIIGSTNKLPTTVLLRKGNRFAETKFEGLTTQKEFSESDLSIVDIDNDGDNDVVAIAGGYENPGESDYRHFLYENVNGLFKRTELPVPPFPASVVRPFDFDHDGDIDLFIGSRVKKGEFPYADPSWLIINEKGNLSVKPPLQLDLGMVTDAVWSDYNKDGWEDLIVTREWNSIIILKNMNGRELVPKNIPELEEKHGIWYSIIAGDFDQDGDEDYIVGNLGENHRFTVSDRYPLQLYAVDMDLDGNIDPLTTAYWKDSNDRMKEYPVNYLDDLRSQSSLFKTLFNDYTSFSYATVNDIFDEEILKRIDFKLHVKKTSSYVLWNEKGNLRWEKLPKFLQLSPIKKMIVGDFNNDSYPDVLLAGNDYTYDVSTGYYDALKGMVLLSNGKSQSFDVLPPNQSGLLLQGMVESLLYFEGDTSLIVAGINRAKAVVFNHHK
jgi:enediyne biosynthesis protein E4